MSTSTLSRAGYFADLKTDWYWLLIAGLVMFAGGIFSLFNPFVASLSVELIIGFSFIVAGMIHIIQAFQAQGASSKIWMIVLGVLALLVGVFMLRNPLAGLVSLTLVLSALLFVAGVAKLIYGLKLRPLEGWMWLTLSGVVSIILAVVIVSNITGAAVITLGVLLAIELISTGTMLMLLAFQAKKLA